MKISYCLLLSRCMISFNVTELLSMFKKLLTSSRAERMKLLSQTFARWSLMSHIFYNSWGNRSYTLLMLIDMVIFQAILFPCQGFIILRCESIKSVSKSVSSIITIWRREHRNSSWALNRTLSESIYWNIFRVNITSQKNVNWTLTKVARSLHWMTTSPSIRLFFNMNSFLLVGNMLALIYGKSQ